MFRVIGQEEAMPDPANGFYEWKNLGDHKQPYFISVPDDPLSHSRGFTMSRRTRMAILSRAIPLSPPQNELMSQLHERMPVILQRDDEEEWLDREVTDPAQVQRLLGPYPAEEMEAVPVSRKVNNVRNDGPELLEPVED